MQGKQHGVIISVLSGMQPSVKCSNLLRLSRKKGTLLLVRIMLREPFIRALSYFQAITMNSVYLFVAILVLMSL